MRILEPCRSPSSATSRPARSACARTVAARARWSAKSPCQKCRRKTSTPASTSAAIGASELLAGPKVATILVRRCGCTAAVLMLAGKAGRPCGCKAIMPEAGRHRSTHRVDPEPARSQQAPGHRARELRDARTDPSRRGARRAHRVSLAGGRDCLCLANGAPEPSATPRGAAAQLRGKSPQAGDPRGLHRANWLSSTARIASAAAESG